MSIHPLIAQIKREYWEYRRSFVLVPMVVALLVAGLECWAVMSDPSFTMKNFLNSNNIKDYFINDEGAESVRVNFAKSDVLAFILGLQQFINWWFFALVAVFLAVQYCQAALFQDRKSREILFWRSMPVSETTNVLIKLLVAFAIIPALTFLMSLVSTLIGLVAIGFWLNSWDQFLMAANNFYNLFNYFQGSLVLSLLVMPLLAWVLFISALVKRNPQLFAGWIPFFLWIIDKVLQKFFNVNLYVNDLIKIYIDFAKNVFVVVVDSSESTLNFSFNFMPYQSLLALSLVVVLLLATIWLRNHRYEI